MAEDSALKIASQALERVGALDQKAASAHARIDELRADMKEERAMLRSDLEKIFNGLKVLDGHVSRSQGGMAVVMVGSGIIGSVIVFVANHILK